MNGRIDALQVAIAELGPALGPAVHRVALAIVEARTSDAADPWVPHTAWSFCPSSRAACALARSGAVEGVRRLDQRVVASAAGGRGVVYLARRSALEAFVLRSAKPVGATEEPKSAPLSGVDGVLAELGLRRVANDGRSPITLRSAPLAASPPEGRRARGRR